ncbi:MAG: DUF1330 domain-containing protein [Gammaproteobacteria bacterium]|nr:DUF1330 domain-containing protein [Gammaproteobacteria bacterium]
MADIPVYIVVNLAVTNAEEYRVYEKGFFGLLKKHGGSFITFDDKPVNLEGDAPRQGRMIIFSFPSEQAANGWYTDPDYQALSEHRRAGTKLEFLTMVHGMPPRT